MTAICLDKILPKTRRAPFPHLVQYTVSWKIDDVFMKRLRRLKIITLVYHLIFKLKFYFNVFYSYFADWIGVKWRRLRQSKSVYYCLHKVTAVDGIEKNVKFEENLKKENNNDDCEILKTMKIL